MTVDRINDHARTLATRLAGNMALWGISHRLAIGLLVLPLPALPIAAYLSLAHERWFDWITDEDRAVEWVQTLVLLLAFCVYAILARRHWKVGRRVTALLSTFVAIGAVAIAGEEISWGQRILGWATPALLDAINYQGEANIHNIGAIATTSRLVQFSAAGYGVLVPLLALLPRIPKRVRDSYFVPPVTLASFFLGPFAYWAVRIPLEPSRAFFQLSEITELSSYTGLAVFGVLSLRRLHAEANLAPGTTNRASLSPPPTTPPGAP